MAKRQIAKASTNVTEYIFIQDSSSTTGAGLTGLVFNSAGLVCYYVRPLAAAVALTLATQTVTGAHSDGGFVEVDSTNMPGIYRLDFSDAICATGVDSVVVHLKGATNMAPVTLETQLTDFNLNDVSPLVTLANETHTGAVIPTVTTLTGHTAQTGDNYARLGAPAGASVSADVAAVKVETNSLDGTKIPDTISLANINTQVDTALSDVNLDHLVGTAAPGIAPAGTYIDILADDGTATYDRTTDSLQAIRDTAPLGTAMRGTDSAALATVATEARLAELDAANIPADVDTLLTRVPDTISLANINTQADTALVDIGLDHLISASVIGTDVADNSIIAQMVGDDATADWDTFDNTTDSLEAIRNRGDAAWITGGGGGITDMLNVVPLIPNSIDLADTATVRIGLMLTNALDDLPTAAEITPGTISIDRKATGGTSWSAIVTDAACSEIDGLVYYDEVFDSGTTYAAGDTIRVTFKSQKVTVAANDYEIIGATGRLFYTYIRLSVANILAGTVDGAVDVTAALKAILAMANGKITKSGDAYTFFEQDNSTSLFTLTISTTERTRS